MPSNRYEHSDGDDYVTELIETDQQTAEVWGHLPYRVTRVTYDDGQVANDGADTETVTVEVVDGLETARGTALSDATVLPVEDDVSLRIDGEQVTVTLTDGVGSTAVSSTKTAPATISVVAEELSSYPTERDSAEIEVVSA